MLIDTGDSTLHAATYGLDSTKPPVIFVHGLGGCAASWGKLPAIIGKDRRAIVVDLRGCGESGRGAEAPTLPKMADDLLAVVDSLREPFAHFVGHSLGGVIVQQFLVDHGTRCGAAVLMSTSSTVGPKATANWRRLADLVEKRGEVLDGGSARAFSSSFAESHPDVVAEHAAISTRCDASVYAAQARAASEYDYTARLEEVQNPVLVIQGLGDRLTSPGGSVLLDRALPNSQLLMIEGAGHNLHIEADQAIADAIEAFFEKHEPAN